MATDPLPQRDFGAQEPVLRWRLCLRQKREAHGTEIIDGRALKSYGHGKPMEEWDVLIKDHHEGYIS